VALIFEYINGFHDTANSIATVVSTKVLSPRQAVMLAAVCNLIGALFGSEVAKTVSGGLVESAVVTQEVLLCALLGAIVWNLVTWYWGLPSSSSHALIGGLVGGAVAAAGNWQVVIWSQPDPVNWLKNKGLLWKVIFPMFFSPLAGFVMGMMLMACLYFCLQRWKPRTVNRTFGRLQLLSAAGMGFMHGTNDAQKTMGIVALALVSGTMAGRLDDLPAWLSFLRMEVDANGTAQTIPLWIKIVCAVVMAAGTAAGGWRIIKTLGHKMVKLQPVHGFAAESASATIIGLASVWGVPVSTTHNISAAIMGVGAAKRWNALRWTVIERMVWAWLLTIPISGALAFAFVRILQMVGWISAPPV
jgi:PiT family inorganic phosphate transporter